ncbi:hypothetical protein C5901_003944 [Escherichia coli O8]|nr:hypothetical protein [Escherichia coli O8]
MRKNRRFTIDDLKAYSQGKGYALEYHRYKRVFTLRHIKNPSKWGWIYFPHTDDKLVGLVDDLSYEGWMIAIDKAVTEINEPDKINH